MTADQDDAAVAALQSIATSLRETRSAQAAMLMNTAAHVQTHAREVWLKNLDMSDGQITRVRAWWKWLDEQPTPGEERIGT